MPFSSLPAERRSQSASWQASTHPRQNLAISHLMTQHVFSREVSRVHVPGDDQHILLRNFLWHLYTSIAKAGPERGTRIFQGMLCKFCRNRPRLAVLHARVHDNAPYRHFSSNGKGACSTSFRTAGISLPSSTRNNRLWVEFLKPTQNARWRAEISGHSSHDVKSRSFCVCFLTQAQSRRG